jgi:protein-L-isoaspartate O-methyltransferase
LKGLPQVEVQAQSGVVGNLPKADAIYVCAGGSRPSPAWLDALRPGARLLFPLQRGDSLGGMLLLKRPDHDSIWPAKFVSRAQFVECVGLQEVDTGDRLKKKRFRRAVIRCDLSELMATTTIRVGLSEMAGGSRPQRTIPTPGAGGCAGHLGA